MERTHPLTSFSDDELLRRLSDLLGQSRRDEADLVAHIGEVDRRRLYAREASPSMFGYCTEVLHLSEAEAYLRIAAARAAREHPLLLTMLADGRLHLTAIAKLAPHLTLENREARPGAGRPPVEARDRGARGGAVAPSGCPGSDAEAARPTGGATSPALRIGPDAEAPSVGLRPEGGASVDRRLRPDGVAAREPELRPDGVARAGLELRPAGAAVLPAAPPGSARGGRAPRPGPLQGPVHRLRRASRQARATAGPHALLGARRRPGRDRRAGRHREAPEARSRRFARTQAPRKTLSQSETSPTTRQIPAAVKRAVYERDGGRCRYEDEQGQTMHGAPGARVPSSAPVRPRR